MSGAIVVTGASGFAGGYLIERLAPHHELVGWTTGTPPAALSHLARWQTVNLLDRDRVHGVLRDLKPRAVYHCAGVTDVAASWEDPALPMKGNVLGTEHLLDGLRRAGGGSRVLVVGSAMVYAASDRPLTEDSPLAPDSPYAVSKMAQEQLALRSTIEDGLEVLVTRSFNHTGARQTPSFVAASVARQLALIERGAHPPVLRLGNLDTRRDLSDVRDIVSAYEMLMHAGVPGEIYNVASGVAHSIRDIVEGLIRTAGIDVTIETDPERLRPSDKPVLIGDASKLRAHTGWAPQIAFDRMLADLLAHWRRAALSC